MQLPSQRMGARLRRHLRLERAWGQRVWGRAAPPAPLWQLERSLIIAALATMSNCKENCLADLLEGSARGRSWLQEGKCLPASPRVGLRLRCHISLVPAARVQNPVKDGEGKVGVMEAGWGRAGRSGWGTCRQWDGHTEEQQDMAVKRDRNELQKGPGRAGMW